MENETADKWGLPYYSVSILELLGANFIFIRPLSLVSIQAIEYDGY